jgi:hypothetical protein
VEGQRRLRRTCRARRAGGAKFHAIEGNRLAAGHRDATDDRGFITARSRPVGAQVGTDERQGQVIDRDILHVSAGGDQNGVAIMGRIDRRLDRVARLNRNYRHRLFSLLLRAARRK